ncbi:transcriptional regulator, AraC family [Chitinophaga jiangningensis]|uniref:Transcriptional regulator, AraC family n=1 Tax=Chitinophaga jiangningensis TaxID=1419482 RepID=A0A1M7LA69_9BACT|nr:AraC family transcriptional regulator [Chitinophaga jiangningensis]SHM74962.1 transcriptional regulator, AraC family [Chitinophaga jiangningensis]
MKPVYAKVLEGLENEVFTTRLIERPFFTTEFHFHAECQMTYIVQSAGHKVVGDCVENFEPGELTLLGPDIPHVWYNRTREVSDAMPAKSVALFFHAEKLYELLSPFFSVKKLAAFLDQARRGIKFYGQTKERLKHLLLTMAGQPAGPAKLISLLEVLQVVTATTEYELLAGAGYVNTYSNKDNEKMDRVFRYIFANFSGTVSLSEAADLAFMNKQAFCRYFKSRTQKTFVDFVNEVRIAHACKLIAADQLPIGVIAAECGFNTLTNFNRYFRKIKGMPPRDYRVKLVE